jgi:hypothetical protein
MHKRNCPAINPTLSQKHLTTSPVGADAFVLEPEFVRVPQLYPLAGIKRGLAYRKINDGTFKSVLMRESGNKQGIRLVYLPSVRAYLHELMAEQEQARSAAQTETAAREVAP